MSVRYFPENAMIKEEKKLRIFEDQKALEDFFRGQYLVPFPVIVPFDERNENL